jgi:ubiquitin-conjugating enzyme E2 J1
MSKSPSLRRIQADIRELSIDRSDRYHAAPLENDMFEWHFTIRGADGTDFEGGVYHGRILLPADYPFKPPHIVFLTPSGRFETGTKVCLSFSAHHPELWQPAWGIRLILEALISFLPTPADGALGALDWTQTERKRLAKKSVDFCCPHCGNTTSLLPPLGTCKNTTSSSSSIRFQKEIEQLKLLQTQNESKRAQNNTDNSELNEGTTAVTEDLKEEESKEQTQAVAKEEEEQKPAATNPVEETPHQEPALLMTDAVEVEVEVPVEEAEEQTLFSWFTDPVANSIILVLSILCFLLGRKWQALLQELQTLNAAANSI